ncbi:MAG: hypothetical protein ACQEQV_03190 [Fibrobacterota bacterium]
MLNTNLLKSKPRVAGIADTREALFFAGKILLGIFALTLAVVLVMRAVSLQKQSEPQPLPRTAVSNTDIQTEGSSESALPAEDDAYIPPGRSSYDELTALEKIGYGNIYVKSLLDFFVARVPDNVDFTEIHVKDFSTVSGIAHVDTRSEATAFLRVFHENADWEIEKKPKTLIQKKDGFYTVRYSFQYRPAPVLLREEPILDRDISTAAHLDRIKKDARQRIERSGLKTDGLTDPRVRRNGKYREYRYSLSGRAPFPKIVLFAVSLYRSENVMYPGDLHLEHADGGLVFDAELIIPVVD